MLMVDIGLQSIKNFILIYMSNPMQSIQLTQLGSDGCKLLLRLIAVFPTFIRARSRGAHFVLQDLMNWSCLVLENGDMAQRLALSPCMGFCGTAA